MTNTLTINFEEKAIIMDRTFAKKSQDTYSDEYAHLQNVRKDYPDYKVKTRTIKRNPQKETYPRLTYARMEEYILTHGTDEEIAAALAEYRERRTIGRCKKNAYPSIKSWFLNKYEGFKNFDDVA